MDSSAEQSRPPCQTDHCRFSLPQFRNIEGLKTVKDHEHTSSRLRGSTRKTLCVLEDYKQKILAEVDVAKANELPIGDILRREGIYGSTISKWRQQFRSPAKRGRKTKSADAQRIAELETENATLQQRLKDYEALTEAQGKVPALLQDVLSKSAKPEQSKQL